MTSTTRVLAAALDLRTFTAPLLAATAGVPSSTARSVLSRYGAYFTKSPMPTGKRGGQLQSWSILPNRRAELEGIVGRDRERSGELEIGRLHLSDGGQLSSSLSGRTRTLEAFRELVTEDELHDYDAYAASRLLPELIVRLVTATTPELTNFSMRIGHGIGDSGFDGRLTTPAASFPVPSGNSVWELGAGTDPVRKANQDYKKRTANSEDVDRSTTTFVFVTNRREPKLAAWASQRRAEGEWADVRTIEAETLFKWLLAARSVHVWVSEKMGLRPTEVVTLDNWFSGWRAQTSPPIPRSLLATGRTEEAQALREAARRPGENVAVISNSREESLAFVASVLSLDKDEPSGEVVEASAEEGELASVLIVRTPEAWSRIIEEPLRCAILVPQFDNPDVAGAVARDLTVIIPMGIGDDRRRATIALPRIHIIESIEALKKDGVPHDDADGLAQAIDRSLTSFRRSHSVSPTYVQPSWADERAELIAPLSLLGSWNSDSEADQLVVESVTRRSYYDVEQELQQLAAHEDAPFIPSGNNWQLASPEDAFALVGNKLTKGVLDLWAKTAVKVLSEQDPLADLDAEENLQATVKGVGRTHSSALRSGIARGAALLGGSDRRLPGALSVAEFARGVVRDLLVSKRHVFAWRTLADVLPELAEAAPEEFLAAVRGALEAPEAEFGKMFNDQGPAPLFGGFSPHTYLLWALELLAQSFRYAPDALFALAHLATIDPGGRLSNRPAESLQRLLLVWYPQTAASPDDRLRVVTQIVQKYPNAGWSLLLGLLPSFMGGSHRVYRPAFRDWRPSVTVTIAAAIEAYGRYADLALELASQEPSKWVDLIPAIQNLPPESRDRYIAYLEAVDPDSWDESVRVANSRKLSEIVAKHRQFPTARWVMPNESLDRLEAIVPRWRPTDLVDRVSPIFMAYPDIADERRFEDPEGYQREVAIQQRRALLEVLASDDSNLLDRLVESAPEPFTVGSTLADLASLELAATISDMPLFRWFDSSAAKQNAARGWLTRLLTVLGVSWLPNAVAGIADLSEVGRARAYSTLRGYSEVLAAVAGDTPTVQAAFWSGRGVEFLGSDRPEEVVAGFLNHDEPRQALEYLSYRSHREDIDPELIISVLDRAKYSSDTFDSMSVHGVGHLLDRLEVAGVDDGVIAGLEVTYFPLLQHSRQPRSLFKILGEYPDQFVDLVTYVFRAKSEPAPADKEPVDQVAANRARVSYLILRTWRTPPGFSDDSQTVDGETLSAWVVRARELLAKKDRLDVGDECIGQVLSGSPKGADGIWPAEAIRDLLEEVPSQHLLDGLAIGEFNARGATSRGPSDGGNQERDLSRQFDAWSAAVTPDWPATGRMLRELSRSYEQWAAREDALSEQWRDER